MFFFLDNNKIILFLSKTTHLKYFIPISSLSIKMKNRGNSKPKFYMGRDECLSTLQKKKKTIEFNPAMKFFFVSTLINKNKSIS